LRLKIIVAICLTFTCFLSTNAQESLHFDSSKRKVKLRFKLVNNLIILPVKVNGVLLNFLLDTGVEETILFSLDEKKEIPLFDVEKINLKGLGTQGSAEGLRAFNNVLSVGDLTFKKQEIIVVLDQNFNFSSTLGIEVNGIIGYHFFSQCVVKIDYHKKKIIIYNPEKYNEKKALRKFKTFDFQLEGGKPYIDLQVELGEHTFDAKCLIDSGNSDGLWLFQNKSKYIVVPDRHYADYLGRGFSGDIFGKKARVPSLSLDNYTFKNMVAAFPDEESFMNLNLAHNRFGSIGGEFLRRFDVIFDYQKHKLYLKKNRNYDDKFRYNTTGITIHHAGLQWYKEEIPLSGFKVSQESHYKKSDVADLKYNFKLSPIYEILNIRKNSAAEKAGLQKDDVLISINGKSVYRLTLEQINQLLKVDDSDEISLVVDRNAKEITFRFKIVDLL
jgi:hypothetical protein